MIQCFLQNWILVRVENPPYQHWNTDSASLCQRWTIPNGNFNLIVIKGQCRQANMLVYKTNVCVHAWVKHREQRGKLKGVLLSFAWNFDLFSWEAYHIEFTLCLLWSSNRAGIPSAQSVWQACVCLCLCFRLCERERKRRKRDLVFYLMASHISKPIFTQFLAWWGSDSGRPETQ